MVKPARAIRPALAIALLALAASPPVAAAAAPPATTAPATTARATAAPATTGSDAPPVPAAPYLPGRVLVGYRPPVASVLGEIRTARLVTAVGASPAGGPGNGEEELVRLQRGQSVLAAAARIRRLPGIAYAVPDYLAHAAGGFIPDDEGRAHAPAGWERLQWNFIGRASVNAPQAWANLIADHRPGGRGVVVAVLDTGVAFRDWRTYRRSPDFAGTRFVAPCDLVRGRLVRGRCTNPYPLDREGHGTFVAGTIAETTNNRVGVTGLAYGASIMPVRVLDASGLGDSATIAAGIRYAVAHGARVINLSLEFYLGVTSADIPDIISAIRYAHARGVVVVAAAGNDGAAQVAYPAHAPAVISVGATTLDRCLADYSDVGAGLDLVAPGGGDDSSSLPSDPNCHPERNLPDVYQMTFNDPSRPDDFSLPAGWFGTSMAAPEVSAAAALVIASGVLGAAPTPDAILARLEATATPLGPGRPNQDYGYGLLNAAAATALTAPTTTTSTTTTPTTTRG
jgi:serine protease